MALQIYRKPNDPVVYEVGTNRPVGSTEFAAETANKNIVEPAPLASGSQDNQPAPVAGPAETTAPSISRGSDGSVNIMSGNKQNLIEAAKELMLRKQKRNADLVSQEAYWKQIGGDTQPFGMGAQPVDPNRTAGAGRPHSLTHSPELLALNQLPMAQQEAVRSARRTAADANLSALSTERQYRERVFGNTITALTGYLEEQRKQQEAEDKAKTEKDIDYLGIIIDKKKNGLPVTREDLQKLYPNVVEAGDFRFGGSNEWNNNNPLHMVWNDDFVKDLSANGVYVKQGSKLADGTYLMAFASEDDGWKAFDIMISDPKYGYTAVTFGDALSKISGGKYTAEHIKDKNLRDSATAGLLNVRPLGYSSWIEDSHYTEKERDRYYKDLQQSIDWAEGQIINVDEDQSDDALNFTEQGDVSLLSKLSKYYEGFSSKDLENLTVDEKQELERGLEEDLKEAAIKYVKEQVAAGIFKEDIILNYLINAMGDIFNTTQLKSMMNEAAPDAYFYTD